MIEQLPYLRRFARALTGSQDYGDRCVGAGLDAVLAGKPVPIAQTPSIGCNIKWKPGNAPDYF